MRRSRKCKISLLSGLGTRVPFLDSHQEYLHPALPSNGSLPMAMSWPPDDMSKIILIPVHEHLGTSLAGALDRGVVRRVERFGRRGTEPFESFEFFQNRNFPEFFLRKFKKFRKFRKFQLFLNYRRNSEKNS